MEPGATDNPVRREIEVLLSDERLVLRETQRAVTPFGGLAVFVSFLNRIEVPGYTFRVFVTSCVNPPEEIWRDCNRRADMENRIAELKHDPGADGFCLKQFFAPEAAFRAVLLLFNLLAEFQRVAGLPGYREPATVRTQVLTCGAIPGRAGRRLVVRLSQSRGGLTTRILLLDSILRCEILTSPKLLSALVT
jgi:hypothetical protein